MTNSLNSSLTGSPDNQDDSVAAVLAKHFENQPKSIVVESEEDPSYGVVDLTEEARQEEFNSATKLNFQLNEAFYNVLRADQSNAEANSGVTMHKDFPRMSFVINEKK